MRVTHEQIKFKNKFALESITFPTYCHRDRRMQIDADADGPLFVLELETQVPDRQVLADWQTLAAGVSRCHACP